MKHQTLHIYTRVSTQTQQDKGTSLDSQKALGIKKAQELGLDYKIWNEGGASSNYEDFKNRPVLCDLIEEIEHGNIQYLWVYNNDRLSRNEITAQTIRVTLQKNSVVLYTQDGKFDLNNPQDQFIKTIFDGLAQLDNAMRTNRTRLGKLSRVKNGFWHGGPPPYGFAINDKKLILEPNEAKWVKRIYEWYATNKSIEWIKRELDKNGVLPRRKKNTWTLGSIRNILSNTHAIGKYNYTDSKTEETVECSCPSIISQSLWKTCKEKREITLQRRGQKNRTKRFYLLRDLLYCGHCGSHMSGRIKEKKNEYLYYCPHKERQWVKAAPTQSEKWKRNTGCSMNRSINIKETDKVVVKEMYKLFGHPKRIMSFVNKKREELKSTYKNIEQDRKKIELRIKKHKQEISSIVDAIAKIETEILLKKQDLEIGQSIIKNLKEILNDQKQHIEQLTIQLNQLHDNPFLDDKEFYWPSIPKEFMSSYFSKDFTSVKPYLEKFIKRIDVNYDQDAKEHELIIHFQTPLVDDIHEKRISLKKKTNA